MLSISASVSGVPRSSSRNELPPSIEKARNRSSPAEGCNLTGSTTSCSSFTSSPEVSDGEMHVSQFGGVTATACPADLTVAEKELRETTRSLAEVARIGDIYKQALLGGLLSYYEDFFTALLDILNKYTQLSKDEPPVCVKSFSSTLVLLKIPSRRLWYYIDAFRRLAELYGKDHPDLGDCNSMSAHY